MNIIEVKNLKKYFNVYKRKPGVLGLARSMIKPEKQIKKAIDGIDFSIRKGEIIGFIGPNGAGKSTTIKILSGILVPTEGEVHVLDKVPYKNRKYLAGKIGVVFGQRTQLWWNLPIRESFDLLRCIYRIDADSYKRNVDKFSNLLELDKYFDTPLRQLSLGQRMRAEIAASLLHNPEIVFLDEPTIGLDIIAKQKIREFITEINEEEQVTFILTTHDMNDIEKVCRDIMVIDKGNIIYRGEIKDVKEKYGKQRILIIDFESPDDIYLEYGELIKVEGTKKHIIFNRDDISAIDLLKSLSDKYPVKDFELKESEIENVIKQLYENQG